MNDPDFNQKDTDDQDKYEYNDAQFEKVLDEYSEMVEPSDEKIDSL